MMSGFPTEYEHFPTLLVCSGLDLADFVSGKTPMKDNRSGSEVKIKQTKQEQFLGVCGDFPDFSFLYI